MQFINCAVTVLTIVQYHYFQYYMLYINYAIHCIKTGEMQFI